MSNQYHEYFTFDGVKSCDYGVWISGEATFNAPERDVNVVEIPGRNGTLTLDNGRWKNVKVTYPCYMSGDFMSGFDAFKNAILPKYGYLQLSDTYHTNGYRMARIYGGIQPKTGPYNKSAKFDITFDCWPQFYLKPAGALYPDSVSITGGSGTISNIPTASYSKPNVVLYVASPTSYVNKSGSITVGDQTITFTNLPYRSTWGTAVSINCEKKTITARINAVTTDVSEYFELTTGDWFSIVPPSTAVSYTGNVQNLLIQPYWWQL